MNSKMEGMPLDKTGRIQRIGKVKNRVSGNEIYKEMINKIFPKED